MATSATHVWRPSISRVLVLDGFLPGPRGLPARAPTVLQWPAKDPSDVLDYQLDIAPALYGNDGDEIATLDVLITPSNAGDLSLLSSAADGTKAVLWLQGGVTGTTYNVNLTIGTVAGRQISRSLLLPVVSLAPVGASSQPLVLEDGTSLVDGNGSPLLLTVGAN